MNPDCIAATDALETPETCREALATILERLWGAMIIEGSSQELVIVQVSGTASFKDVYRRPASYVQHGGVDVFVVNGEAVFSMIEYVDDPNENLYVMWRYAFEAFRHLLQARMLSEDALITPATLGSLAERYFSYDALRHSIGSLIPDPKADEAGFRREIDARAVSIFAARVLSVLLTVVDVVSAELIFSLVLVGESDIEKMVEDYTKGTSNVDLSDSDGFFIS
jgi:hypothetical protein